MLARLHVYAQLKCVCVLFSLSQSHAGYAPSLAQVVANTGLLQTGAAFGDGALLALTGIQQQMKRVMGSDPQLDLNVGSLRNQTDAELTRILFLAVLGNFTNARSSQWNQPCSLVIEDDTGAIVIRQTSNTTNSALQVLVILLCVVLLRQWFMETRQAADTVKGE